jgi:hypothetical protein
MKCEFNHRVEAIKVSGFNLDILCIPVNSHPDFLPSLRFDDFPFGFRSRLPHGGQTRSIQILSSKTAMLDNANSLFQNFD